ncbi:PCNA-interacting partner isoform X2 [Brachyhypopomus gauderio]|uniref:PCNA-interacting partner isoform X2 n=1 Tax=Brachyhypopomus gauderio TaxID=698409 RepID=UPI004041CF19
MGTEELNLKTVVRVFRRSCHRVLGSERSTLQGADSMLMVLQLCAAEVRKQERGEFAVALSDVLAAWKRVLLDKLHLSHHSAPLPESYELIRKEYDSFLKRTNTVDLIDVYGMYNQLRLTTDPEVPLTATQLFEFLRGDTGTLGEAELEGQCPATPSSRAQLHSSQVQRLVRRIFFSYLSLLVNTKDDLAVAHTLNTPARALGLVAFTDLKHAARQSNTSLFLAATSFVRAVQLGGRGYAPSVSDPLRKHMKGLSQFVHFTDQLEEILGETPEPSVAGARIVSSIRAALLKSLGPGHPATAAVENTADELKDRIRQIHTIQKESATNTGISPARPRAYAINHATAYEGRETVKVLMALLDEEATAPPCRNSAELLSADQAILDSTEGGCLLTLFRSPEVPTGLSPKPLRQRIQGHQEPAKSKVRVIRSQFACTYLDDGLPLNRVLEFPSTNQLSTCMHPAPKRQRPSPVTASQEGPASTDTCHKLSEVIQMPVNSAPRGSGHEAVLVPRIALMPTGGVGQKLAPLQKVIKTSKRKLESGEGVGEGREENQPPQKRAGMAAHHSRLGTRKSRAAPRKVLAGQSKLTSFFRL